MPDNVGPNTQKVRTFPPPPKGFDALAASRRDLMHHGLPQRPDPETQPVLAALWEQRARRYQGFEFREPKPLPSETSWEPLAAASGLPELFSCGYELFHHTGQITMLTGTWTVPNLNNSPNHGLPNNFRTFFGLGFLDVHVEMKVDAAQNVTALVRIHTGAEVDLPVSPGDMISATLCLQTDADGTAFYGLVNETTAQIVNLTVETGFPPAVTINAGISRGSELGGPPDPLARFGVVYFDELQAFATDGSPVLTNGVATRMVDSSGKTLATTQKLTNYAFKVVFEDD